MTPNLGGRYSRGMTDELQVLVDDLAKRLNRSVAIDDPDLRLLAHSDHFDEIDAARIVSIMHRSAGDQATKYSFGLGSREATDLFFEPPEAAIGQTFGRIGMSIRRNGHLLGFVWLMGHDSDDLNALRTPLAQAAEVAAVALERSRTIHMLRLDREFAYVQGLMSTDRTLRTATVAHVGREHMLDIEQPVTAVALMSTAFEPSQHSESDRRAVVAALDAAVLLTKRGMGLRSSIGGSGTLLINCSEIAAAVDIASAIHAIAVETSGRNHDDWWVGVGNDWPIDDAATALQQARHAATAAGALRSLGTVVTFEGLGVYGPLTALPREVLAGSLDRRYLQLANVKGHRDLLVDTLEMYLDNAGSVQQTRQLLSIERASLYYRLRRIEEVAGIDLNDGNTRLALHMSLKMARLLGLR